MTIASVFYLQQTGTLRSAGMGFGYDREIYEKMINRKFGRIFGIE